MEAKIMKLYYMLIIPFFTLVVSAVLIYFFIPLSAERVYPEIKNIGKIYVDHSRGEDGEIYLYEDIPVEESDKLKGFSKILSNVEYSRISKSKDILNPYRFFTIIIMYRTQSGEGNNFEIQVNENGLLNIHHNGMKQYKIINGEGKKVFNQIKQFVHDSGIVVKENN